MVPHSEKPSKRWKPLNTENTPVRSVERSVTKQPRSILGVAYAIDPALSLSTVCQMLFDGRFNFVATRDKLLIKKHHRAKAKSKLNENLRCF